MQFRKMNMIEQITLSIIFQIFLIRTVDVHHVYTRGFSTSRDSYLDNDSNLISSNILRNKDNLEIIVRQVRQAQLNTLNQDIVKLNIQITNLTDTMKKESNANPNSSNRFINLENEIKKIKEDIERMKSVPNVADSSKFSFHALESSMDTLQKLFDDKNRVLVTQMGNLESFVNSLTNIVIDIRRELDRIILNFEHEVDEKENQVIQKLLPAEIIQDIKGRDFDNAIRKTQQLKNLKRQVNFVIYDIYNKDARNFDLVLKFENSSRNAQLSLLIYEALIYEIGSADYFTQKKLLCKLSNNVESPHTLHRLSPHNIANGTLNEIETIKGKILLQLRNQYITRCKSRNISKPKSHCENIELFYTLTCNADKEMCYELLCGRNHPSCKSK